VTTTVATWGVVLLLAFISGLTTLLGVALGLRFGRSASAIPAGIGFSAGIMVLLALGELLPAALAAVPGARVWGAVALGAGVLAALHIVIPHIHLVEERGRLDIASLRTSYLVALGLALHDFPEGVAMANAYLEAPSLGILVFSAVALHNVPEGFAMAVPAAADRRPSLVLAAVGAALSEPAGTILGLTVSHADPGLNALLMALAAGAMLFVSVHELLPMALRFGRLKLFGAGLALSVPVYLLLAVLIRG
jgi:ZIP family zinc transporter